MAYDEEKAKAMRGADEPDGDEAPDDKEEETGGEPSEEEIQAAKRLKSALASNDWRAVCAAVKDLAGESY